MRLITWNCNVNFKKKFELLHSLSPDIAIIQECEKLDLNYFPNCQYFWCGKNEDKSMAVLIFNRSAKIDSIYNDNFRSSTELSILFSALLINSLLSSKPI